MKIKRNLILLFLLVFGLGTVYGQSADIVSASQERGEVLEVKKEKSGKDIIEEIQIVKLRVLTGEHKGEVIEVENPLSGDPVYDIEVKAGDKVLLGLEIFENDTANIYISDYSRQEYIFLLLILFLLILILIGGKSGLKAIGTLVLTLGLILKLLLPLMLRGINPLPISVLISILITIVTIGIISGISYKSLAAIVGTSSGVIIAGLLSFLVGSRVKLTGLSTGEAMILAQMENQMDIRSLLFAGIILGSLGAIMDVGMSIASAIEEIHLANQELGFKELFSSGMNVGRDVMGTMTNTLILAYAGSSIPLMLIFMSHESNLIKIINLDIIATEIVRSLSGSIGLILTIPITALIASKLIVKASDK